MNVSKLYNLAIKQGGTVLENNNVYRVFSSKNGEKLIQQTITPNGSYATHVSQNG